MGGRDQHSGEIAQSPGLINDPRIKISRVGEASCMIYNSTVWIQTTGVLHQTSILITEQS